MASPQNHVDFGFLSFLFFSCFFDQATARTAERILMVNGSNDAFPPKDVPFGGRVKKFQNLGAWRPKNPKIWGAR